MASRESRKPLALSEEYVVDSSDDQDGGHSDQTKKYDVQRIPETPSKQRRTTKSNEHKKRKTASPSRESSSSSPSQEEDSEVDGEEEDEDEPGTANLLDESAKQASPTALSGKERSRKKSKTTPTIKRSIPPKQYDPPKDFVKTSTTASDSASRVAQFLTNDLGRKEVWHITAPANVSIESIKPFAIRSAMRGEPILYLEGKCYCLKGEPSTNKYMISPNDTGDAYLPGEAAISRTFHLREIINPPAPNKVSEADASKQMYFEFQPHDELPVRPKRKQPEGLRMRYKPFGTTHTSPEESNAEAPNIYIPNQIPSPIPDRHKKRKQMSQESRGLPASEAGSDAMEVDPSQTSPGPQIASQSRKLLKNTPSKKLVIEASSARQEKTKKKSKKNKDHETAST